MDEKASFVDSLRRLLRVSKDEMREEEAKAQAERDERERKTG
jgi:hypothetical protein